MNRIYKPLPQVKYRPLPKCLTIKQSKIEGLGLFAKERIMKDTVLGVSHVKLESAEDGYLRTPLGGFINHSDDPNCVKWCEDDKYFVKTIRPIHTGEELFLKYTFYDV